MSASTKSVVVKLAERFDINPEEFEQTVKKTVCPANITNEQFMAFMMVAAEYSLNPITKQIYAFPAKGGGIVPVVSIDGWLRIINTHPEFDGMEFVDTMSPDGGKLVSVTCRMHRKDRTRPVEVTEYMAECRRSTDVWNQWPARMLRHKATIQCARYAFGLSGIYDEDEAQRIGQAGAQAGEKVINEQAEPAALPECPQERFEQLLPQWKEIIRAGKKTTAEIYATAASKYTLTQEQQFAIDDLAEQIKNEQAQGE